MVSTVRSLADLPAWTVRRSTRARRARITVTDDAHVVVVLPQRAPIGVAEALVRQHEPWVRRHVAMALARRSRLDARPPLFDGRVLEVNGVPHAVVHQPTLATRAAVRRSFDADLDGVTAMLEVRARDIDMARRTLEAWLRAQARRLLVASFRLRALLFSGEARAACRATAAWLASASAGALIDSRG